MIELIREHPDGSKSYRITHTETVTKETPVTDDAGNLTGEMRKVRREVDVHKPLTYAAAPGTPESEIEAIDAQVLANVKAGRDPFHRDLSAAENLAEEKELKRSHIQSEADQRLERAAGSKRDLQRMAILGDTTLQGKAREIAAAEDEALAAIEAAKTLKAVDAVTLK